jgi:L-ascorbate metabolism protein UlaG (beta-lactamase superfamily)
VPRKGPRQSAAPASINHRILFSGDTALSDSFAELRASGPFDLAIMPIGA